MCWDSNPRPLEHESPPITTRPGLPPWLLMSLEEQLSVGKKLSSSNNESKYCCNQQHHQFQQEKFYTLGPSSTPLGAAVRCGQYQLAKYLISRQDVKLNEAREGLMIGAIESQDVGNVEFLLSDAGIDVNFRLKSETGDSFLPVHAAMKQEYDRLVFGHTLKFFLLKLTFSERKRR